MIENNLLKETKDTGVHPLKKSRFDRFVTALAVLLIIVGFSLTIYGAQLIYPWLQFRLKIYPYAKDKKAITQGKRLYRHWCQNCHGELSERAHILKLLSKHHFPADYYQIISRSHLKVGVLTSTKSLSSEGRWKIVSYIFDQSELSSEEKSENKKQNSHPTY